jgi:dihydrofolate reductase
MNIAIIVAMDANRGIGKDNGLLWHLPADMKFFKESTLDNIVVMGRKNFESIPEKYRPLARRENVILTRNKNYKAEGCLVFNSIKDLLKHYENEEERTMFIIGGGEIYKQFLDKELVDEMYITKVNKVYTADTFFSEINLRDWRRSKIKTYPEDAQHEANFDIWKYEILSEQDK